MIKKTLLILAGMVPTLLFAQPVLNDGTNWAPMWTTGTVKGGLVLGPGSSGANVTWDFSAAPMTDVANFEFVSVDDFEFFDDYVAATHIIKFTPTPASPFGTKPLYNVYQLNTLKLDMIAFMVDTPGEGDDYRPNALLRIHFPSEYEDTITEVYQKTGNSADAVRIEYDGYGTLNLPGGVSYTNVVRLKSVYAGYDDYEWYMTSPYLMPLAFYSANDGTLAAMTSTNVGVGEASAVQQLQVFPNPASSELMVNTGNLELRNLNILDISGKLIRSVEVDGNLPLNRISIEDLQTGVYFLQAEGNNGTLVQKFTKQ